MTSRKRNFADLVKSAANTPTAKVEDDLSTRFSNAENLLKERPTGFALPQAADKSDEASETLVSPIAEERSEEHTSELQSLMRISYAVFCLKKKNTSSTDQKNNVRAHD